MYWFEIEADGRQHLHFERWEQNVKELFRTYPANNEHNRLQLVLIMGRDRLEDIPVHWNPHLSVDPSLGPHHTFHQSHWSSIFEVYTLPSYQDVCGQEIRLFVEDGHAEPTWGEPITLFSTASDLYVEHSNRFAFFRGKYWKVLSLISYNRPSFFDQLLYDGLLHYQNLYQAARNFGGDRYPTMVDQLILNDLLNYDSSPREDVLWYDGGF